MREGGGGSSPSVAVIICCYTDRRRRDLVAAIRSVHRQRVPPSEVIVVVDHNPGLLDWLRDEVTEERVIVNVHARGLTGARNTGVEATSCDLVAFLDDDATAETGWLETLVAEFTSGDVIAVGGRINPKWSGPAPEWFPPEFGWVIGCSYVGQPGERALVRNVIGANMSFRRTAIQASGGFRAELGRVGTTLAGCEETELCIRAAAVTGGHVVYQPKAVVTHQVSPDRHRWTYFRTRCYAEGRSKAVVARLAGTQQTLGTERAYVRDVLVAGFTGSLRAGLLNRQRGALGRAAAIAAGLLITTAGYLVGTVDVGIRTRLTHRP